MAADASSVTPNRRGTRSREAVLDAAERLMAEQGYGAATIAALVDEAGLPASSIYHYFGSKEGVLLAVMERGADRFFESLPDFEGRAEIRAGDLGPVIGELADALEGNPDFLRILIVMVVQPVDADAGEVLGVVNRVREVALERLRRLMELAFGVPPRSAAADHLARFALASFDGAFMAAQSDPDLGLAEPLAHLPAALAAIHAELTG